MKFISNSAEETIEIGEKIGKRLIGGEIILLSGELGGGKTQFTKGIGKGLKVREEIISPTFTIERIYIGNLTLHHFDFYRLSTIDPELYEELDEISKNGNNVTVVEWPENLNFKPDSFLSIHFTYLDEDKRKMRFEARGAEYEQILESL